jgi:ubiquinone/menaquinone biosynthesis C-methylase UbiE
VLEVGPGTGYYTFGVAERLDGGALAAFDVQQEMLDHVMREAEKRAPLAYFARFGSPPP